MSIRHLLAGCLALAAGMSMPAAGAQAVAPTVPVRPAPIYVPTAPIILTPKLAPPPKLAAPAVPDLTEYSASTPAPREAPGYSDLCRATPKPPWCEDAGASAATRPK